MPGPIFLHFQTYSRKANAAGNSVAQVIAEALRRPDFSAHVENPQPPRVVLGIPATFEDDHAAHVEARSTEVKRKGKTYRKGIRTDRHTLATAVASYPLTHDQIAAGGDAAAALHREWEAATVKWMQDRYGDQVKAVLAHEDESHPHLHFWLLPDDQDARADTLHPGKVAKRLAEDEARAAGLNDREAVRVGNIALKAAMRDTLEDYWREVGQPLGMTRDGPKRQRLTRAEWKARKEEAMRQAEALRRARGAEEVVQDAEARAAVITDEAEARDAETKEKRGKFNADAREWVERNRKALDDRKAELDKIAEGLGVQVAALEKDREEVRGYRRHLLELLDQAEAFLRRPDLPSLARKAGAALMKAAGRPVPEPATGQGGGGNLGHVRRLAGIKKPAPVSAPPKNPVPESDRSDDFSM